MVGTAVVTAPVGVGRGVAASRPPAEVAGVPREPDGAPVAVPLAGGLSGCDPGRAVGGGGGGGGSVTAGGVGSVRGGSGGSGVGSPS